MAKSNVPVVELKHVDMTFTKHGGIGKKPTLIHALTDCKPDYRARRGACACRREWRW